MNGGTLTVVLQAAVEVALGERSSKRNLISIMEGLNVVLANLLPIDLKRGGG